MVMTREIPAGRFKARCLALLDEVAAGQLEVVVTKRGRPVARVVALEPPAALQDSVEILVGEDELMAPLHDWEPDLPR